MRRREVPPRVFILAGSGQQGGVWPGDAARLSAAVRGRPRCLRQAGQRGCTAASDHVTTAMQLLVCTHVHRGKKFE